MLVQHPLPQFEDIGKLWWKELTTLEIKDAYLQLKVKIFHVNI